MATGNKQHGINRRELGRSLMAWAVTVSVSGCATPWFHKEPDPEAEYNKERDDIRRRWQSADRPQTIYEITRKVITLLRVENIALVTELPGTGGKVAASSQREKLLDFMRRKNVPNPNQWLDDPSTAMVVAQVIVPPAARKRDRLNVLVSLSKHAEAANLQGGWLMNTELVEMSVLDEKTYSGFGFAMARGQLVTKQQITGSTADEDAKNAIVVGGAELLQSRTIGLAVADEFAHAVTMNAVVPVINKRFTVFDGSGNVGAAKINNVNYIELNVPPQYRLDPDHFANVVQHLGVAETAADKQARLERCKLQLLDPITSKNAAWQLEAVGKDAIPMLLDGLVHPDKEVRFYAAHALAYLDDGRSIPVLQELATIEPAFRAMCLNAISLVRNYKAGDALEQLLSAPDPETRYGAVLAMREYDNRSPLVVGEKMGEVGSVLEVPSTGPNLVAVGLTTIPEVVIFGPNPPVNIDAFMYVNPRLMIRSQGIGRVSISHIVPGRDDRTAESTADMKSILRGISEVGGGFGDWVNFVRLCGADKLVPAEVAMNPVPLSGRKYNRDGLTLGTENSEVPPAAPPAETLPVPTGDKSSGSVQWLNPLNWFGKK